MSLTIVLGTRPEIIKCAPVVHEALRRGVPCVIIHTGQHYTPELDEVFFRELDLPAPITNLNVGSLPPAKQVAAMMDRLYDAFLEWKPSVVVVQGDTNSVLAGALTAHKMGVPVAHLEAGLRSDDWGMPEEGNRVLAGNVADIHFCPTEVQRIRLATEGVLDGVHVVGNTVVDAARHYVGKAEGTSKVLETLNLEPGSFALLTMHRPSNVDEPGRLGALIDAIEDMAVSYGWKIVFPVHPRTETALKTAGLWDRLEASPVFVLSKPVGYLDLLHLQASASLVVTDSGGMQEEANILQVPCITLRANTERPETVKAGGNVLYEGTESAELIALAKEMTSKPRDWTCPFGDGRTAERVMDVLMTFLDTKV
ncbi:UDP-N-acetylglucosamine 2-epimerase (non-hydrolyzing) [Patescibacteria group bacterium]|nr:UDP-N-acetylglucosamine 2-epimerase (non-hydrolyzing) [Patescibacteria group bacterium]MBU1448566.1 UDP-N-acetylglucosamine 2-epimerase (non-hydrolyzing) [Patescibacteria group bacterium]MBU2613200.1 UDP-N-acetylglucosamine 2-epimerase (non-hydrolyzing) [Patescibacteria group bacterium]